MMGGNGHQPEPRPAPQGSPTAASWMQLLRKAGRGQGTEVVSRAVPLAHLRPAPWAAPHRLLDPRGPRFALWWKGPGGSSPTADSFTLASGPADRPAST